MILSTLSWRQQAAGSRQVSQGLPPQARHRKNFSARNLQSFRISVWRWVWSGGQTLGKGVHVSGPSFSPRLPKCQRWSCIQHFSLTWLLTPTGVLFACLICFLLRKGSPGWPQRQYIAPNLEQLPAHPDASCVLIKLSTLSISLTLTVSESPLT